VYYYREGRDERRKPGGDDCLYDPKNAWARGGEKDIFDEKGGEDELPFIHYLRGGIRRKGASVYFKRSKSGMRKGENNNVGGGRVSAHGL